MSIESRGAALKVRHVRAVPLIPAPERGCARIPSVSHSVCRSSRMSAVIVERVLVKTSIEVGRGVTPGERMGEDSGQSPCASRDFRDSSLFGPVVVDLRADSIGPSRIRGNGC